MKLLNAISKCRADNPFIFLQKKDMDVFQAQMMSGFSKLFADGLLAGVAGLPTVKHDFFIAVVFENYREASSYKIHVVAILKKDLPKFDCGEFCDQIDLERGFHVDRLETLKKMVVRRRIELITTTVDGVRAVRICQGEYRI